MSSDWSVNLLQDEPIRDTKLLGLEKTVEALYNFLSSESMITPLAIAINGEWGSGKTSLINTLKNKIDHGKDRITIFFDAWKYEYSDPAAGLFLTITEQLSSKTKSDHLKEIAKNVGSLALDIFSRHYIGISTTQAKEHFRKTIHETGNLSEKLEELVASTAGDNNVIVLIDDLDRCSLDNVIKILDSLKIFLNMKNFVFVIAVDMSKIKLAWSIKHGEDDKTSKEGLRYLDKIFQIEISIPSPSSDEIKEYIHFLNPHIPVEFVDLISITGIRNPRSIKKLLNLISLRTNIKKRAACHFRNGIPLDSI